MPKSYPAEFRRKVLDLVAAGRSVAQVAADLDISDQTIYVWRRPELIDTGQLAGMTSAENAELRAARRRIASRRPRSPSTAGPPSCSARWCPQKTLRGDRGDGLGEPVCPARLPGAGGRRVWLLRLALPAALGAVGSVMPG